MKTALCLLLAAALLMPKMAAAAGPADSPGAYTFTADGGLRLTTGALGPTTVTIRCGAGTAEVKFIWLDASGSVAKVAPRVMNGTAGAYPLTGDGVHTDSFVFQTDGPDSIFTNLISATKADAIW